MASINEIKRSMSISFVILLLCSAVLNNGLAGPPPLPNPQIKFAGAEDYVANGQQWVRYNLRVINYTDYPNYMFAPAPGLPVASV